MADDSKHHTGGAALNTGLSRCFFMTTGLSMQTEYHFQVSSTNSFSLTSSSADSTFTTQSPITITIILPADGANITRPDIMVKGTFTNSTGNETGITINGIVATVYGGEFTANHVPLAEGANTIIVTATDASGYTATASITITADTTGNYMTVNANIESGMATLDTTLRIESLSSYTDPSLTYIGPGTVDWTSCTSYDACAVKIDTEGIYYFTAKGKGSDGNPYEDTIAITALSLTEMDALLQAKWEGMKSGLANNEPDQALAYLSSDSQEEYREIFDLLAAQLAELASGMGAINMIAAGGDVAEYYIKRQQRDVEISYFIYFVKDENGLWKIRNF